MLFDEAAIARQVDELARRIVGAVPRQCILIGLLKGSYMFMADLVRALARLGHEPQVEFLRLSSYGTGKESTGTVRLLCDTAIDVSGRDVILVDDIVDTGRSLAFARDLLRHRGALVRTCALVDKPSRRVVDITIDFVGFTVGNVFVVGYGIDYAEQFRFLPYLAAVE